jgi:hypothetical protein
MASTLNPFKQMTVTKFMGIDYKDWAYQMQAVLEAIDLWVICRAVMPTCIDCLVPADPAHPTDAEAADICTWDTTDSQCTGYLKSYITKVIMEQAIAHITVAGAHLTSWEIWDCLWAIYDTVLAAAIFSIFRKMREWCLDVSRPPLLQLDQLEHHYQALTTNMVNILDFICVMTLLSTLPLQWETFVTPRLLQGQNITTVTYQAAKEAILLQWDT